MAGQNFRCQKDCSKCRFNEKSGGRYRVSRPSFPLLLSAGSGLFSNMHLNKRLGLCRACYYFKNGGVLT